MTHSSLGRQPMSAQPRPYSIYTHPTNGDGAGAGAVAGDGDGDGGKDGVVFRLVFKCVSCWDQLVQCSCCCCCCCRL